MSSTSSIYSLISEVTMKCPYCGSPRLVVNDRGEVVCPSCGTVVVEHPIAYIYSMDYDRSNLRVHFEPLIYSRRNTYGTGDSLGKKRKTVKLLKKYNRDPNRYKKYVTELVEKARNTLSLPTHVSNMIYNAIIKYVDKSGRRHKNALPMIVAAAVYIVCKKQGLPVSIKKIGEIYGVRPRQIMRTAMDMNGVIDTRYSMDDIVASLIERYGRELGMEQEYISEAISLARRLDGVSLSPQAIAAGTIYVIVRKHGLAVTQEMLSRVSGKAIQTIRVAYRRISSIVGEQ